MRIGIGTACAIVILISTASAHPPQPYVGGMLQRVWINEVERQYPYDDTMSPWISYSGFGGQLEGGLSGDFWKSYLALRHDAANHRYGNALSVYWSAERIVLGARIHVSDHDPNPIKPVLGAGVSLGWAKRRYEDEHGHGAHTKYSQAGLGWLAEGGIMFRIRNPLSMFLLLRIEDEGLHLEPWEYGISLQTVRQASLSVGWIYRLNRK